jgi:hypothetical protein
MVRTARIRSIAMVGTIVLSAALVVPLTSSPAAADGCTAPTNPVACENTLAGTPGWEDDADSSIEGFASVMSTDVGDTVDFKINTDSTDYRVDIYRHGWYGGVGARKVATLTPSVPLPQEQPACLSVPSTGLVDCSNWGVSASWSIPGGAVSGVYRANLVRLDGSGQTNHITFVVRSDASHSDLVFQTSDTTWQAYNVWGGNSLYQGAPGTNPNRAYKVSYNRPEQLGQYFDGFETGEYAFIRWIERNGFDVSYISGVDTDRDGAALLNHKAFLSVGHDEYWSSAQRTNVEAARDAGVDLAFFSGNEVYWKTRWEPGLDGGDRRTLVSYKESFSPGRLDPTGIWTGTWQDPRNGGGNPANSLTGTLFVMNGLRYDPLTVPSPYRSPRLWRGISSWATPTPDGVLGMEWDTVPDNGKQPPGLIQLSQSTESTTNQAVTDLDGAGVTFGAGSPTHAITLYRAASGALVFGAGMTQWSWALDPQHSRQSMPVDPRIQQATVNLFADMGAQPRTIQSGLTLASASTDTTGASAAFAQPASGASVPAGQAVAISGTATDAGGGVPAGVEVSTDGSTWHPAAPGASGFGTWSYTWTPTTQGAVTLRARATDDSANLGATTSRSVTVTEQSCPCTLFGATTPTVTSVSDSSGLELGVRFSSSTSGSITGVRFFKGAASNGGTHLGRLWSASGALLAQATFTSESASGWQTVSFPTPVPITAGATYVASYYAPQGHYAGDAGYFAAPFTNPPLTATSGFYRYGAGGGFPTSTSTSNYWVDVTFSTSTADTTAPVVTGTVPADGATGVATTTPITATLSEPIAPGATLALTRNGTAVAGSSSYDAATTTMRFTPSTVLAASTTYVASLTGVTDTSGNAMAGFTWSFTTAGGTTTCSTATPCTLLGSRTPAIANVADNGPLTIGVRFSSSVSGWVTGVRFYKGNGANGGTHIGGLWTTSGAQLASATFQSETASGWQTVSFGAPVPVSAGTSYIASYYAPSGHYSADASFFQAPFTNSPLTGTSGMYRYATGTSYPSTTSPHSYLVDVTFTSNAPPADTTPPTIVSTVPASNATNVGVSTPITATVSEALQSGATLSLTRSGSAVAGTSSYDSATQTLGFTPTAALAAGTTYTATAAGVRDTAGNAMANYSWSFTTTAATDTTPPTITARAPASGATNVSVTTPITATLSEAIQSGATITLANGGSPVAGTPSFDAATLTLRFTPTTALLTSTAYTATVTGVRDTAGNAMADSSWSFTTAAASSPCNASAPCSVFGAGSPAIPVVGDTASVELAMVFSSSVSGTVTGLRFYKGGATNGGTHIGRLWSGSGALLATATFTAETGSGWQTVLFATPVTVTAGTQYVASYYAPQGHYSGDVNGLASPVTNGPLTALAARYRYGTGGVFPTLVSPHNYWIDVLFTAG